MLKFRPPTDLLSSSPSRSSHSSCMTSPTLDSLSEDGGSESGYFERDFKFSPPTSESASTSDVESDDAESDATLEEAAEIFSTFGHPLERIPRTRIYDIELMCDSDPEFGHGAIYHPGSPCSSCCSSRSQSFSSLTSSSINYEAIIDDLLNVPENPFDDLDPQNFVTFDPNLSSNSLPASSLEPPLMIKRTLRDSDEASIFHELNATDLRQDPWNPCPHILQVVNRDPESEYLYLCMERLHEFNYPPMSTVAQYIDFFRQILEGITFLHEHQLVGFSCSDPNSYMVDLSSGPPSNNGSLASLPPLATMRGQSRFGPSSKSSEHPGLHYRHNHHHHHHHHHPPPHAVNIQTFDRSMYPVRYYFVNFTRSRRIQDDTPTQVRRASSAVLTPTASKRSSSSLRHSCPFKQDVRELGILMDRMLSDVPSVVSTKFKPLIKAMTIGGFGAEDSRKLFEALCRSLEAGVFEMAVRGGAGLRSQSMEFSTYPDLPGCGSTYTPSSNIKGDFGLEPDTVSLSS